MRIRLPGRSRSGDSTPDLPDNGLRPPPVGSAILNVLASLAARMRRPIVSFCNLATADDDALVTFDGCYMSLLRIDGLSRLLSATEIEQRAVEMRSRLSASLERPGHALQFHFVSDPGDATDAIDLCVSEARRIATLLHAEFDDVFAEWKRVFPEHMRSEQTWLALWSKPSLLSKQEAKDADADQKKLSMLLPRIADAQDPTLAEPELAARHAAFVQQIVETLDKADVRSTLLSPHAALEDIRSIIDPHTKGDGWRACLPSDRPPQRIPDVDRPSDIDHILWPPVREQLFLSEAESDGFMTARIGALDWSPLDMALAPDVTVDDENPINFTDLVRALSKRNVPWRTTMLIEGVNQTYMSGKAGALAFLNVWPNKHKRAAFVQLADIRDCKVDTIVRLRGSFATCAPAGERQLLQSRVSRLQQGLTAWAGCQGTRWCGDPVAGVMSSVPGLDTASTAPSNAVPLCDALTLMPWARPGLPWKSGSILFRYPDGAVAHFDPAASGRPATLDLFIAPSRSGKSVAANRILLGTVLSTASATNDGYKLPLIFKLDIGESVSGFVDLVKSAIPENLAHLAAYYRFDLTPEYAFNLFDLDPGCRHPTAPHKTFLVNFLGLMCRNEDNQSYDRMHHLIEIVIDTVYDYVSDAPGATGTKLYCHGDELLVDRAIRDHGIPVDDRTTWYEIVDALIGHGNWRAAGIAQRRAVPVIHDLIVAVRESRIDRFRDNRPTGGVETIVDIFVAYIQFFAGHYPTLCTPTRLDLGDARIIGLDIERVCPRDRTPEAKKQTELMYLLGLYIGSRKLMADPDDAKDMPSHVRDYHRDRLTEYKESYKRLELDEWHRTGSSHYVGGMVGFIARESAKYRLSLGLTSQSWQDFGSFLLENSTGRFIFGAANPAQADRMSEVFGLSAATSHIVKHRLNGPASDGSGAPFVLQIKVDSIWYEQALINQLGPIELWALSTNPVDRALRTRLYRAIGPAEARRRLSKIFPKGTAASEIDRRKSRQGSTDLNDEGVDEGAVNEMARELIDCTGLAAILRSAA
ncbi:MAG: type IV secretion protein DotO [Gluconacetobacter sp.]